MKVTEVHHPCRYGWLVTIEFQGGEFLRMGDIFRNTQAEEWSVFAVPTDDSEEVPAFSHAVSWRSPMRVFVRPPGEYRDDVPTGPTVGDYKVMSALDDATISAAVGWWVARLRGEEDLRSALHEFDVIERMGKAQDVVSKATSLLRRNPIPEEKLQGFEADLREWLRGRFLRDEESYVSLQTDYEPCWPPLVDLAKKHGINGFRFPWKTHMKISQGKVTVNGSAVFDGNEPPEEATQSGL